MIKAVLFDLDGTLLPMDYDEFVNVYFSLLTTALIPYGYEPKSFTGAIWGSVKHMAKTPDITNEQAFWQYLTSIYGEKVLLDKQIFDGFYIKDFDKTKSVCKPTRYARKIVDLLKTKPVKLAVATNPMFPKIATEKRISWAGLDFNEFELVTTFENSRFLKPDKNYYAEIVNCLGVNFDECLMVGNDVCEDMIAKNFGMKVFLLTDYLLNKNNEDINGYPHGNFDDLIEFIEKSIN